MSGKQTGNGIIIEARETGVGDYEAVGCIYGVQPSGIEYDTVVDEQCLDETGTPATELGDPQASESIFTHSYFPGGSSTEKLRGWAYNRTLCDWRIVYPSNISCAAGVIEQFKGRIRVFQPAEATKTEFMRVPVTVLVDGNVSMQCLGQTVVDIAAMTALAIGTLTTGDHVRLDNGDVYRWDAAATSGDEEPDDKANPGVDPGYWILQP